jgi:hypothetical protein
MVEFIPHPEIALTNAEFDSDRHKAKYLYNYPEIFRKIANGEIDKKGAYRSLILNDLFFIVLFVMGIEKANHPFVVNMCRTVQEGPRSNTLDIWARAHYKSTIITQAETIQYELKNPNHCTGIFAYSRPAAKKFLRGIKVLLESSDLLKWCFPDILYGKPESESPKWSEDDGLVLKRSSSSRGESSVEAWGLTEGMPTGRHFERCVFDDLETEDIRESPDMLDKVFSKFEMAGNLGTFSDSDVTRVIGTYYSHFGPNVRIRDKKMPNGDNVYKLRLVPGSNDGTRDGKPVLMDLGAWEKEKTGMHFNSQQLCDPTPTTDIKLDFNCLKPIEPKFIPRTIHKFMVLDQAGGDETDKQSKDMWSYGVIGIEPILDDIGQSNVYLLDIEADQMSHSEGIDGVVRMYLRNGIIQQMGVEKVGLSTTEIHIANALRTKGRRLSLEAKNLVLLKPAGRSKNMRVETALQWPLNNSKISYSTSIPDRYIQAIREEMLKFPFYHVDILDMIAYAYDLFKGFRFPVGRRDDSQPQIKVYENPLFLGLRSEGLRAGL